MSKKKCTGCNRELLSDCFQSDRYQCRSCVQFKRRVDKSLDRLEWDHIRALREAVSLGHRPGAIQRRTKEQRQEERALIARRAGVDYVPRGKVKMSQTTFDRRMYVLSQQNAKQAWNYWIKIKAPDWWLDTYYMTTGKPWLDYRMSDTERYRTKYNHDPEFQINERVRRQFSKQRKRDGIGDLMRMSIKNGTQSPSIEIRLGYSVADLKKHLERQFTKGMTWDAFMTGAIHIDHIIPQSSFDLMDDGEWNACWALTNLQPLWKKDNLTKGSSVMSLV